MTDYLIIIVLLQSIFIGWLLYKLGRMESRRMQNLMESIKIAEENEWYELAQELKNKLKGI